MIGLEAVGCTRQYVLAFSSFCVSPFIYLLYKITTLSSSLTNPPALSVSGHTLFECLAEVVGSIQTYQVMYDSVSTYLYIVEAAPRHSLVSGLILRPISLLFSSRY